MSQDRATLLDILKAARFVTEFQRNIDNLAFLDDRKTQFAILHQFLVLGEAVKRLSEDPGESSRNPLEPDRRNADKIIPEKE